MPDTQELLNMREGQAHTYFKSMTEKQARQFTIDTARLLGTDDPGLLSALDLAQRAVNGYISAAGMEDTHSRVYREHTEPARVKADNQGWRVPSEKRLYRLCVIVQAAVSYMPEHFIYNVHSLYNQITKEEIK